MIQELQVPLTQTPRWLIDIDGDPQKAMRLKLPLNEILKDSLYYPACGLDKTPIKYFSRSIFSFVYADHAISGEDFLTNFEGQGAGEGLKGYRVIFQRKVFKEELVPEGWKPNLPSQIVQAKRLFKKRQDYQLWGHWSVWERNPGMDFGATMLSVLYLCGEASTVYQGLYSLRDIAPRILALIQPGGGISSIGGRDWEKIDADDSFFKANVMENSSGKPELLLYGGIGDPRHYEAPCWAEYAGPRLSQLPERNAGLWKLRPKAGGD